MSTSSDLYHTIKQQPSGLGLAELLVLHPQVARRTAQRLLSQMLADGQIAASGEGRARRYLVPAAARPEASGQRYTAMSTGFSTATPLSADSRAILNRLLIDLSWASSNLEGNTYSRLDTRHLIETGAAASGKAAIETQMILNHKAAIELLVDNIDSVGLNRYTLMNLPARCQKTCCPIRLMKAGSVSMPWTSA